eukprot:TRINITY_DN15336_c1_g1_i3.p14 TRINITY_DN15336_c1_g1~~TRINITY_DN15336_c1_g1_i3.p14  ORF type:complete len:101 (+),score=4.69 TRINITY_DN15336_c1_g1_i3:1546-1848(+)
MKKNFNQLIDVLVVLLQYYNQKEIEQKVVLSLKTAINLSYLTTTQYPLSKNYQTTCSKLNITKNTYIILIFQKGQGDPHNHSPPPPIVLNKYRFLFEKEQ